METSYLSYFSYLMICVLILPMRNGNKARQLNKVSHFDDRSYPTYEEWKHAGHLVVLANSAKCSYPTYEEWKLWKF